jgi:hypothetical protein
MLVLKKILLRCSILLEQCGDENEMLSTKVQDVSFELYRGSGNLGDLDLDNWRN